MDYPEVLIAWYQAFSLLNLIVRFFTNVLDFLDSLGGTQGA